MDSQYSLNEVVWAKIKGFPWWPGIVISKLTLTIIDKQIPSENK